MKLGIKAKDKFVWQPSSLTPPPIYVRISQIRKHGSCVVADCWQETANGDNKHWKRTFPLPLPATLRREDWTFEQIGVQV